MRNRKRHRREFTPEFRQEAVKLMNERLDQGVALAQVGRDLDLEPDLLRKWARELGLWGSESAMREAGEMDEPQLKDEVRRLRRELERVRAERDFLKKATAFFAKESH
jgi:transposase